MLRAAAKNWQDVAVVIDPTDYPQVLAELKSPAGLQKKTKFALAKKVFAHTAAYDGMITNYLTALADDAELHGEAVPARGDYPATFTLQLTKVQDMRYGENPHQAPRSTATRNRSPARSRAGNSCRARNSRSTTSPTPTPRGSASRPSTCRPA